MLPSSDRITSGDPALAQAIAHSLLMGLSRCLVKAHAESNTYPFTVTGWELSVATPGIANAITRTNPTLTRHTYFIRRLPMNSTMSGFQKSHAPGCGSAAVGPLPSHARRPGHPPHD